MKQKPQFTWKKKVAWETLSRNASFCLLTERSHLSLFSKQTPIIDFVRVTLSLQKCSQIKCLHTEHTTSESLWNNSLQSLCKFKRVSLSCSSSVWCSMKNCIHHLFWREMTDAILMKVTNRVWWIRSCEIVRARWGTMLSCKIAHFSGREGKPTHGMWPFLCISSECFWSKIWRWAFYHYFYIQSERNYFKTDPLHFEGHVWSL